MISISFEHLRDSYKSSSRSNKKSNGMTFRNKSHVPLNTMFREEYQKLPCKKPSNHLIKVTNTNASNSNAKSHNKLLEFNNTYGIKTQEPFHDSNKIPVYSLNKKKRWEMSRVIKQNMNQFEHESQVNVQLNEKDILRSQKLADLFKPNVCKRGEDEHDNKEIMNYEIGLVSKKSLLKNVKIKNEKKLNKNTKRENYYSRKLEYDDLSEFSSSEKEDNEVEFECFDKKIQINLLDLIK